jgi:hypothetical protein
MILFIVNMPSYAQSLSQEQDKLKNAINDIFKESAIFECKSIEFNMNIGVYTKKENDIFATIYNKNNEPVSFNKALLNIDKVKENIYLNWKRNDDSFSYEFIQKITSKGDKGELIMKNNKNGILLNFKCEIRKNPGEDRFKGN